ncbi:MAG TPA: hypothetical protein VJ140_14055 [Actinomycetota bacterium]|nr:hypothetical protein [Actinomycetota bacterium]
MIDPRYCAHPRDDVVTVEEGLECCRCGLVAQVMPAPGREYRMTVPAPDRAKEHINEMRADLARRKELARTKGRAW